MKEFYIGQKVVVSDAGENYTTYGEMAKKMNLSNWSRYNNCPIGEKLTIVAKEIHENNVAIVYGLRGEDRVEYLAGGGYFSLAKPTRTEYVKVTESIFDLKEEFESGRLFHNECVIRSATVLAECYAKDEIYRRIEKEVDWRNEVRRGFAVSLTAGFVEMRGKFSDENFLEMCRVALRATGELPE